MILHKILFIDKVKSSKLDRAAHFDIQIGHR